VLDTGIYQTAIAARQPEQRPMFTRFTPTGVVWADGTEEPIDTVIYATGYRPNLDYLADLDALDANRRPVHWRGISSTVPGLAYVGLSNQSTYASATLRGVGPDAAYVVGYLRHHLRAAEATHAGQRKAARHLFDTRRCCAGKEGAR
jgi:putative flavoprotein involved in K+ transport